ncbi:DNA-directed RNA polymerase I and III polypeptide [Microthyrium microscopicum]|uniref:DNA-directed RNA polymerases I and III subunit RPAC2 n=1 Tax=Microthyrium microscopicum TaxID=703497 RepID=A0A6A6UA93_9PEZI|nr:DNA-directed RNA polymerase I and III polypeptide [Microthyrium microscopicum]
MAEDGQDPSLADQEDDEPKGLNEEFSELPPVLKGDEKLIELLPGATDNAASFLFRYEDHTLGNALRHIIMKNPQVEFCGYSIPHPAEAKMHIRIQTYDDVSAQEVLEKGLDDLADLCDVVVEKFNEARNESDSQMTA